MKVLIVSYYFYPEITPRAFRTTELAKEFARQDNVVKVLTKPVNVPKQIELAESFGFDLDFFSAKPMDFRAKWKSGVLGKFAILVNRFLAQFLDHPNFGIKRIVQKAFSNEISSADYDLVISIAHPHAVHWGLSQVIKRLERRSFTWVADCGDPFMRAQNLNYQRPFYFWYYEILFCETADWITVPFLQAKEGYLKKYHNKIKVIPQGFSFEDIDFVEDSHAKHKGVVKIGYAGTLVKERRDPKELIEYLDSKGVKYEFHIYTNKASLLKHIIRECQGEIILHPYVDRLTLLKNLQKLDFVVNFQNKGINQLPSKLIDYALIKKPILDVKYGSLNEALTDEFINGDYRNKYEINNLEEYNIKNVISKFEMLESFNK
jgi:hypothetical protein